LLIPWETVLDHCPDITGIIHAGAHTQEEKRYYGKIPVKWIEADPELFEKMDGDKYNFAATAFNGWAHFNVTAFRAASSLLEPHLNAERRADVRVIKRIKVPSGQIRSIQADGYNFLNLDIQGAELDALIGTDLSQIDYIYSEVHKVETYRNCTKIKELDNLLTDYKRVITKWTRYGWGDALWIR